MTGLLKPCPFCGGRAEYNHYRHIRPVFADKSALENGDYYEWVSCTECGSCTRVYNAEGKAVEAWGRRKPQAEWQQGAPTKKGYYLTTYENEGKFYVNRTYYSQPEKWNDDWGGGWGAPGEEPVAWSELPEPYTVLQTGSVAAPEAIVEKLNPCPMCGEKTELFFCQHRIAHRYIGGIVYAVKCGKCGAESGCFISKEKAMDDWNGKEEE